MVFCSAILANKWWSSWYDLNWLMKEHSIQGCKLCCQCILMGGRTRRLNGHADVESLVVWPAGFEICGRNYSVDSMNRVSLHYEVWTNILNIVIGNNLLQRTFHTHPGFNLLQCKKSCTMYKIVVQWYQSLYSVRTWCILQAVFFIQFQCCKQMSSSDWKQEVEAVHWVEYRYGETCTTREVVWITLPVRVLWWKFLDLRKLFGWSIVYCRSQFFWYRFVTKVQLLYRLYGHYNCLLDKKRDPTFSTYTYLKNMSSSSMLQSQILERSNL